VIRFVTYCESEVRKAPDSRKETAMSEQENIQAARESIEAFNRKDKNRLRALMTNDSVYAELGTQRRLQGPEEILRADEGWWQAFPDATGTVTRVIASGDTLALEVTWVGTQTGALVGPTGTIPPSGKRATVEAAQLLTFEGAKIKEVRQYFDMATLLQQIGAVAR
jgi:steroid delta-isomerase-like uncharacterized protein